MSATVLSFSCVWSLSSSLWQENWEPQSRPLTHCVSSPWCLKADLKDKTIKQKFEFEITVYVHLPIQQPTLPPTTCDIMENFVGSRTTEGNAVLFTLFWESTGIHQAKNTNLNHRIPWIVSPSALWCEWHLSHVDLGCEVEKQRCFTMD